MRIQFGKNLKVAVAYNVKCKPESAQSRFLDNNCLTSRHILPASDLSTRKDHLHLINFFGLAHSEVSDQAITRQIGRLGAYLLHLHLVTTCDCHLRSHAKTIPPSRQLNVEPAILVAAIVS